MKSAVLVIDVQQGLCEGEGAAFDCAGTITRINAVTRKARQAGVPVFFIQHESSAGYLEYGTDSWQLARGFEVAAADRRVRKTTPDSFLRTDLESLLRAPVLSISSFAACAPSSVSIPARGVPSHLAFLSRWYPTPIPGLGTRQSPRS